MNVVIETLRDITGKIPEQTDTIEGLGIDSLDLLDAVLAIETKTDKRLPVDQLEKLVTVGDLCKWVEDNASSV